MQKELRIELVLKHHNPELKSFLNKFSQLMKEKKKFILGWHSGNKLFLIPNDNTSIEKNYFISLIGSMREKNVNYVSLINCAISLHVNVSIKLKEEIIEFTISSSEACQDNFSIIEKLYSYIIT